MRTTNMFYGYKRLCDQRVNGMARYHKDGIAEAISALLQKAKAFIQSIIEKVLAKISEIKAKYSNAAQEAPVPPEVKKSFKDYLDKAATAVKSSKKAMKALSVAISACEVVAAAYLGLKTRDALMQKMLLGGFFRSEFAKKQGIKYPHQPKR